MEMSKEKGGRFIQVYLSEEFLEMLDALKRTYGCSHAGALRAGLEHLYRSFIENHGN